MPPANRLASLARQLEPPVSAGAAASALQPLQPDTAALMAQMAALPVPAVAPPIEAVRRGFDDMLSGMAGWGIDTSAVHCTTATAPAVGDKPAVTSRCYAASPSSPDTKLPALLYIHGGGWTQGTAESYGAFTAALCARGHFAVISVEYRLAPEHPAPAAADDCFTALQWLAAGAPGSGLRIDTSRLALAGDSAGGHLTLLTALSARQAGIAGIVLQVPIEPRYM